MSDTVLIAIVAGLPALVTGIAGLIIALMTRKDAVRKDTITLLQTENERLSKRLELYQAKFDGMEAEIDELRGYIQVLQDQVYGLGGIPVKPRMKKASIE